MSESKIIIQYQKQLLAFITDKVTNREDAEDILADVFLKLLKQDNLPTNPIAWLYHVTNNQIIDYYRKKKPLDELPNELTVLKDDESQFYQLTQCIQPMIKTLKPDQASVIQLIDIEGLKQQQAAEKLNISKAALKSRLLRARKQLKSMIVNCCPPVLNKQGSIEDFNDPKVHCAKC